MNLLDFGRPSVPDSPGRPPGHEDAGLAVCGEFGIGGWDRGGVNSGGDDNESGQGDADGATEAGSAQAGAAATRSLHGRPVFVTGGVVGARPARRGAGWAKRWPALYRSGHASHPRVEGCGEDDTHLEAVGPAGAAGAGEKAFYPGA